jgi:four helix bundle protein
MSQYAMEHFGGYQKARELFDLVVQDMGGIMKDPRCYRLVAQQVASADSICANIEEGYGRLSRAEYVRFLDFSRGSARETRGRYERLKNWLPAEVVQQRVGLADEIIGILTKTIVTLRRDLQKYSTPVSYLKDEMAAGDVSEDFPSPDIRHSPPPPA